MNQASVLLRSLARHCTQAYLARTAPRAVLLTGSAAQGESDTYSDLDLIMYYDGVPPEEAVGAAREQLGASRFQWLFPRTAMALGESYTVDGIECQVVHHQIADWEQELARALDEHDPDPVLQKMIGGLIEGMPLHGDDLIGRWQVRAEAYPEGLARAMVETHLRFFPLWYLQGRLGARDAALWQHQILLEGAQNILGALAGLNRVYYSSFQFKRMRKFIGHLRLAPADLAERLEHLLTADSAAAGALLEQLVSETVALVDTIMPGVDTSSVRGVLGQRQTPWSIEQ